MGRENKKKGLLISIIFLVMAVTCGYAQTKYYKYVDPFIGSEGLGNVVGPSCPYGMIKPGPDCSRFANAGYHPDIKIPVFGLARFM